MSDVRNRFTIALLGILSLPVSAATIPVEYAVDAKALKAAVAGTNLSFRLYGDAACTNLLHTQVVAIESVDLVSQLKLFKAKGAAKPAKTAEMRHTLTGAPAAAVFYLQVTGTGITPVGGACQLQRSVGTASSGGAAVVKDSTGKIVGPSNFSNTALLVVPDAPVPVLVPFDVNGFVEYVDSYYTSPDCSGPALFLSYSPVRSAAGVEGGTMYYPSHPGAIQTLSSRLSRPVSESDCTSYSGFFIAPESCCCMSPGCTGPFTAAAAPLLTLDVSQFTPPFHVDIQ